MSVLVFLYKFTTAATRRKISTGLYDKICNWAIEDVNFMYNKIFVFSILMLNFSFIFIKKSFQSSTKASNLFSLFLYSHKRKVNYLVQNS